MRQETQWTTIFWEGWTALALCAAAVFWPGSAALGYPAVLWPGLALAAAVPVLWAGWWLWAEKAPLLPEEELMAKPGRIHISWVFVKQFSRNDMATACQDWLRVPG